MNIQAVVGEIGRYWCDSASGDGRHLVDLMDRGGTCGCADYTCRHRKFELETGKPYRCRHIKAVRETFLDDVLDAMKTQMLER